MGHRLRFQGLRRVVLSVAVCATPALLSACAEQGDGMTTVAAGAPAAGIGGDVAGAAAGAPAAGVGPVAGGAAGVAGGVAGGAGTPVAGGGGVAAGAGGEAGAAGAAGGGGAAGAAGGGGAAGAAGSAGAEAGAGGGPSNPGEVDPVGNANRNPGFIDLSPPMGEPLPMTGDSVTPAPPAGWSWYDIAGTQCRDGSGAGIYMRRGTGDGLLIYLEGGGACSNDHYCAFNPNSVNQVLAGDGQVVLGSALGAGPGRQQPGAYTDASHVGQPAGIFDVSNPQNPFGDWTQIYVPYCTGDVHFGANPAGMVPNVPTAQKFVGYSNMQKIIGRVVPTFRDSVSRVVLTGASAGGFGAALNFSMVQDAFGDTPVFVVDDSGPPFDDQFMPPCMQKRWRETWGFDNSLPPDCDECRQADGAGLLGLSDFLLRKHPVANIAIISSLQDEVIRLFYSVGLQNCANYETADPVAVVLFQGDPTIFFPGMQYQDGLMGLRQTYGTTGRLATFYISGVNMTFHQHIFRPRFYEQTAGGKSMAQFVSEFLDGTVQEVGP